MGLLLLMGCALEAGPGSPTSPPDAPWQVSPQPTAYEDVRCEGAPAAGPEGAWRHTRSQLVALADPHHRGVDVIAAVTDTAQTLDGKITYGPTDKDLEDEDVDLFACLAGAWARIGTARTDEDGRFALALTGDARLPLGMRDLYVSVIGDRSGAAFLAFVGTATQRVIVSDIDGTLTESENEYPLALATGTDTDVHPQAGQALTAAATRQIVPVYISARGDRFTRDTRTWLATNGFPRGPIYLPRAIVTIPGEDTIAFKTAALARVAAFELVAGIGNRATDIAAYAQAGLAPARIFIKLDEFVDELAADLGAGRATGFASYEQLRTQHVPAL